MQPRCANARIYRLHFIRRPRLLLENAHRFSITLNPAKNSLIPVAIRILLRPSRSLDTAQKLDVVISAALEYALMYRAGDWREREFRRFRIHAVATERQRQSVREKETKKSPNEPEIVDALAKETESCDRWGPNLIDLLVILRRHDHPTRQIKYCLSVTCRKIFYSTSEAVDCSDYSLLLK